MAKNSLEIAERNIDSIKEEVIDFFEDYAKESTRKDLLNLDRKKLIDSLYVRLSNLEKEIYNAPFVDSIELTFKQSGNNIVELIPSANFLSSYRFNMLYETTADAYRRYELKSLSDFAKSTIKAVENALERAIRTGESKDFLLETFYNTLGLNPQQELASYNYGRYLIDGNNKALLYENRDKTQDSAVSDKLLLGSGLSYLAAKKLKSSYQRNAKIWRLGMFSSDQAHAVSSLGEHHGFIQAGVGGAINLSLLNKTWKTSADELVRAGHSILNGKTVKFFDVFVTSLGALRFPRDDMGYISNIINCRCWLMYSIG